MQIRKYLIMSVGVAMFVACSTDNNPFNPGEQPGMEMPGGFGGSDDGTIPDFDTQIYPYQGQEASDKSQAKVVGDNEDFYWELNSFKNKVDIIYNGETASFTSTSEDILVNVSGAHVTVDFQTNGLSGVQINLSGSSDNGSLKIYGEKKFLLNLNGVELASKIGPAINNQCKKRMFVNLKEGTVNKLTDSENYSNDSYYLPGNSADGEDRKGAFFSEANLIFSGAGALIVAGKQKHGIASDGYMYMRPGVTIAVTEAVKNAIHIKGDKSDDMGIVINGGLIYTLTEGDAGKGLKTDFHVEINGGQIELNTKGVAIYDADENDTSSASGIKADGNITINGGNISIKSVGTGGKGINADGDLKINGGETTIVTTGGKYIYNASQNLESSPKGIKTGGDITIDNGKINIMVTGVSDSSEGMESKSTLTINDGEIYIYAYDDAINASTGININGGKIYAYAVNNDAIDSNGYLYVNDGLILAFGAGGPEEAIDCEVSSKYLINGGIIMGSGGTVMTKPSSSSKQNVVLYSGVTISKGQELSILDSQGNPLTTFTMPRSMNSMTLFLTSPEFATGKTYTVSKGGTLSAFTQSWNGWYAGGKWSNGTSVGTFTPSNRITSVGGTNGPGGGMGGFPR